MLVLSHQEGWPLVPTKGPTQRPARASPALMIIYRKVVFSVFSVNNSIIYRKVVFSVFSVKFY